MGGWPVDSSTNIAVDLYEKVTSTSKQRVSLVYGPRRKCPNGKYSFLPVHHRTRASFSPVESLLAHSEACVPSLNMGSSELPFSSNISTLTIVRQA
jgi:hypothetical protein